jgi:acetyl esterase/lipase
VIFLHGGFWQSAYNLEYGGHLCQMLAGEGVATWNVEYRRVGEAGGGWPGTLLDVAAATKHVTVLSRSYPLDLSRVVVSGHSAGGHLALWLAARHRVPVESPLHGPVQLPLRGVVSVAGVSDLIAASELGLREEYVGHVSGLMGGTLTQVPERYAAGSPAALLPFGTPQILIHGSEDDVVPLEFSEHFTRQARAAGDDAVCVTIPGADHFEPVDPLTSAYAVVRRSLLDLLK